MDIEEIEMVTYLVCKHGKKYKVKPKAKNDLYSYYIDLTYYDYSEYYNQWRISKQYIWK